MPEFCARRQFDARPVCAEGLSLRARLFDFNERKLCAFLKRELTKAGAKSVKSCVLVDKTWRESEVRADYVGFHATRSVFLAGYGLDDGTGFGRVLDHLVKSTPKD